MESLHRAVPYYRPLFNFIRIEREWNNRTKICHYNYIYFIVYESTNTLISYYLTTILLVSINEFVCFILRTSIIIENVCVGDETNLLFNVRRIVAAASTENSITVPDVMVGCTTWRPGIRDKRLTGETCRKSPLSKLRALSSETRIQVDCISAFTCGGSLARLALDKRSSRDKSVQCARVTHSLLAVHYRMFDGSLVVDTFA